MCGRFGLFVSWLRQTDFYSLSLQQPASSGFTELDLQKGNKLSCGVGAKNVNIAM